MWSNRRFRLFALFAFVLVVLLSTSKGIGAYAYDVLGIEEIQDAKTAPGEVEFREDNRYYLGCLSRRDAGDMACGEVCYWRECITCRNTCQLDCPEYGSCYCYTCPPKQVEGFVPEDIEGFIDSSGTHTFAGIGLLGFGSAGVRDRPSGQSPDPIRIPVFASVQEYDEEVHRLFSPKNSGDSDGYGVWAQGQTEFRNNFGIAAVVAAEDLPATSTGQWTYTVDVVDAIGSSPAARCQWGELGHSQTITFSPGTSVSRRYFERFFFLNGSCPIGTYAISVLIEGEGYEGTSWVPFSVVSTPADAITLDTNTSVEGVGVGGLNTCEVDSDTVASGEDAYVSVFIDGYDQVPIPYMSDYRLRFELVSGPDGGGCGMFGSGHAVNDEYVWTGWQTELEIDAPFLQVPVEIIKPDSGGYPVRSRPAGGTGNLHVNRSWDLLNVPIRLSAACSAGSYNFRVLLEREVSGSWVSAQTEYFTLTVDDDLLVPVCGDDTLVAGSPSGDVEFAVAGTAAHSVLECTGYSDCASKYGPVEIKSDELYHNLNLTFSDFNPSSLMCIDTDEDPITDPNYHEQDGCMDFDGDGDEDECACAGKVWNWLEEPERYMVQPFAVSREFAFRNNYIGRTKFTIAQMFEYADASHDIRYEWMAARAAWGLAGSPRDPDNAVYQEYLRTFSVLHSFKSSWGYANGYDGLEHRECTNGYDLVCFPVSERLIDSYKFPCEVSWTQYSDDVDLPAMTYTSSSETCVVGHNTQGDRSFTAEPVYCDDGTSDCPVSRNPPDGYRIWPVGRYKVDLLVDGSVLSTRYFRVGEYDRPVPWQLVQSPDWHPTLGDYPGATVIHPDHHLLLPTSPLEYERPMDGRSPPAAYKNPGRRSPWPQPIYLSSPVRLWPYGVGIPYPFPYDGPLDDTDGCVSAGWCSEDYPWEHPLPWGSPSRSYSRPPSNWGSYSGAGPNWSRHVYEIRPEWGDYSYEVSHAPQRVLRPELKARTAPYPEQAPGWDFIYPQCPRLDWCNRDGGDPCEADLEGHYNGGPKKCRPDYCAVNYPDCVSGCPCGGG